MIVILTQRGDPAGPALAARWSPHPVAVLTALDLSHSHRPQPGWSQHHPPHPTDTILAGGILIPQHDITAVLTLTPAILSRDLPHIVPADRTYVADEITAFLLFWLSGLACPVLNRPAPPCLSGPNWLQEQWVHAAAQCGIPVQPFRRAATLNPPPNPEPAPQTTLTVVGNQVLGDAHPTLHRHALNLARRARVDLLAVHFSSPDSGALFLNADTFPDPTPGTSATDAFADALLQALQS